MRYGGQPTQRSEMTLHNNSEKASRLLIVAPSFPHWDKHARYLRLWEIIRILSEHGHRITFLAVSCKDRRYRQALEALGLECITHDDNLPFNRTGEFRRFLEQRGFNVSILVFYWIYNRYEPFLLATGFGDSWNFIANFPQLHVGGEGQRAAMREVRLSN